MEFQLPDPEEVIAKLSRYRARNPSIQLVTPKIVIKTNSSRGSTGITGWYELTPFCENIGWWDRNHDSYVEPDVIEAWNAEVVRRMSKRVEASNADNQRYGRVLSPLKDAISALTGRRVDLNLQGVYDWSDIDSDDLREELQDWCSLHAKPHWATGLSMIEAAELIVSSAVENGNIPEKQ